MTTSTLSLAENAWTDGASGREYVLLDEPMTWNQANHACVDRGFALFDSRSVSDTEAKALLGSDLMADLEWVTHFAGTSQEMKVATIWQTAEEMTIAPGSDFAARTMMIQKKHNMTSSAYEWRNEDEFRASTICMAIPAFWYRCSMEVKCTYDRETDSPYSRRYQLADYGGGEGDVMRNIIHRTEEAPFSITEGACVARTESAHCLRVIPSWSIPQ